MEEQSKPSAGEVREQPRPLAWNDSASEPVRHDGAEDEMPGLAEHLAVTIAEGGYFCDPPRMRNVAIGALSVGNVGAARNLFSLAALDGDALAWAHLGEMWEKGQGGAQSLEVACQCYARAAEQGQTAAAHRLGLAYLTGRGMKQSLPMAAFWLSWSAAQPDAPSRAATDRDMAVNHLTPAQVQTVQRAVLRFRPTTRKPTIN